jgi:uncharacterized protein YqgC (DUF456 family)
MSKVVLLFLVCLGCGTGVVLSAVRLPGIWLMVGGAALLGWLTQWELVGLTALLWICGLAILAEVLEFLMSAMITRRAGGSRKAAWGALIGGFVGLLFLSIPLPIIGSVIGALLGCFLGAAIGELSVRGSIKHGTRVGVSAAIGFALGTATKVALAFLISIIAVTSVINANWPVRVQPIVAPAFP